MQNNHHLRGVLCTLFGSIGWGFSGACGQYLLSQVNLPSSYITFMRVFFAGIILTLINLIGNRKNTVNILKSGKNIVSLIIFGILGLVLSQFSYIKTISYSNAGTATVLQYLGPAFIMIYVCITSKRLPRLFELISIILAFSGVVLLATHGNLHSLQLSEECLFWGVLAAIGLMLYSILPKNIIKEWGAPLVTGYGMLFGGIFLSLVVKPQTVAVNWNIMVFLALSAMIIIGTVCAYTMYLQGVQDIGAVKTSMIACIEPVSAAVFSYLWFNTMFTAIDILGFVLILSTVFILNIKTTDNS